MSQENIPGPVLLALFRQEVETHTSDLSQGLLEWENNPSNISKIEPLMRAAHSLKGAARIIGLDNLGHLAHALEDCFVLVEKNKVPFKSSYFDILFEAIDFLSAVAKIPEDQIFKWIENQESTLDKIIKKVRSMQTYQGTVKSIPRQSKPKTDFSQKDFFIHCIFANEVTAQCKILEKGLLDIQKHPTTKSKTQALFLAISSIKGTSDIANQSRAVKIATEIEGTLVEIENKTIKPSEKALRALLKKVDSLKSIASEKLNTAPPTSSFSSTKKTIEERAVKSEKGLESPEKNKPITNKNWEKTSSNSVRISATNLNRLMALAAESLVETHRLQPLKQGFLKLKTLHSQLTHLINQNQNVWDKAPHLINFKELSKEADENSRAFQAIIQKQLNLFDDFSRNNSVLSSRLYREVLDSRMRPFSEGLQAFPRLVRTLGRSLGKKIQLEISGNKTPVDRDILEKLEAPLNHIIRNSCDHGIEKPGERLAAGKPEKGTISIEARHSAGMLILTIRDDGRGIDKDVLRKQILEKKLVTQAMATTLSDEELFDFLFLPRFSTADKVTELSGRGVGLDVVHNLMQEIGGKVRMASQLNAGTTFYLQLPITRSVIRALMVDIHAEPYAFPLSRINRTLRIPYDNIKALKNHKYVHLDDENIAIIPAGLTLGLKSPSTYPSDNLSLVILGEKGNMYGLVVDHIVGEHEVVVRPLDLRLGKIPCISAASINDDGTPVLILDVDDLLSSMDKILSSEGKEGLFSRQKLLRKKMETILVVDDSPTVRETERRLLQEAGYAVEVAVDGADGWNTLRSGDFDLVVSDVDMPRMNGFEFVSLIKNDPNFKHIPVIIVSYKDRTEDREQGLAAGADYYLTKNSFHDDSFISVVKNLIKDKRLS